jgi:hypothetical protein
VQGRSTLDARGRTTFVDAEILMENQPLTEWSANVWAFIVGHELAHLHVRGGGTPEAEMAADRLGARFARDAGYDAPRYLRFLVDRPNACSPTHGCWHRRAYEIGRALDIDTSWISTAHLDHAMPAPARITTGYCLGWQ